MADPDREGATVRKVIRFDEDHFGYLVPAAELSERMIHELGEQWTAAYPGKKLIVMEADEFIDLTGQYEIVPIEALA
jgi:hypothetical protein